MTQVHHMLEVALAEAVDAGDAAPLTALAEAEPADRRDRVRTLLGLYALHGAPLERLAGAERFQHAAALAALRARLESAWLAELAELASPVPDEEMGAGADPVQALRLLASWDRLPPVYRWLATEATAGQVREFLALEGGPDSGFDDLVAVSQLGLSGRPKMELARNYWDEMGDGDPAGVHTDLHTDLVQAMDLVAVPEDEQPTEALERTALCSLLTTNRWLQPELLGAGGLIELQAGPRCRLVTRALERIGAPAAAVPFYAVHADVDPLHGRDWVEGVIAPLAATRPGWGPRMVRGALWRWHLNARFFDAVEQRLCPDVGARRAA